MSNTAIHVENLGKQYFIGAKQERYRTFRDTLAEAVVAPFKRFRSLVRGQLSSGTEVETIWALKDVSFEVKRGEVVGIIGRNGAGKSTLLKILSRITEPTEGFAEINGRVGSLLEVGTGFHPELTGRENIYLNGAILGMTRTEIEGKFDEIVAFAEVTRFLDTPVKHYSSGMHVRLAFAVAAHLQPEVILVDEVLSVGDAAFQKKCLGKMGEDAKEGRTVLFVSHNMAAVESLCSGACLIEHGRLAGKGPVTACIASYMETMRDYRQNPIAVRTDRQGTGKLRLVDFVALDSSGSAGGVRSGSPTSIILRYAGAPPLRNVNVDVGFYSLLGEGVLFLSNEMVGTPFAELPPNGAVACHFDRLALLPGSYSVNIYCTVNGVLADWVVDAARLDVAEGDYFGTGKLPPRRYGAVIVPHRWESLQA